MKSTHQLINENSGHGFFGTAAPRLGYRQAGLAYAQANSFLVNLGFTEAETDKVLDSKLGTWWADFLDWSPNYGDVNQCRAAVAAARRATNINDLVAAGRKMLAE